MNKKNFLMLVMAFFTFFTFNSCTKEENDAPVIDSAVLSSDNKTIAVTFSEAVYSNSDATGALNANNLDVVANGEVTFSYSVSHNAGGDTATIDLIITSSIAPTVTFTVKPSSATSVYDSEGEPMALTTEATTNTATQIGIVGKWLSDGDNVAPLLGTYFNVGKVYATFNANNTYVVNQFNKDNSGTTPDVVFTGTYAMTKSTTGEIWTITCYQELPYAAEASGIFEVKTNPEVLWYEVVQTTGTQNVPPTPTAGFGSSNNGSLGTINIQKYVRIP